MATLIQHLWSRLGRPSQRPATTGAPAAASAVNVPSVPIEIAPDDPLLIYLQHAPTVTEVDRLPLDSPAVRALRATGVKLVVSLVSQGEVVGLLNLGPRRSEQDYSTDDRALLGTLATQAAPAVRVAQLVRQQQLEALTSERLAQELRVAREIQLSLLPKEVPDLPGWQIAPAYHPARVVGGDFYDFLELPDGQLVIVIGDVTDKGVPAALVMATTRSVLRGAAGRLVTPGAALERSNDVLCPEMPPNMFVTCFYALLDPATGRLRYANAGHDLPYHRHSAGVSELEATGMPLGLMPGMRYDEYETLLQPGDTVLLHSDGLVEAHNPRGEMFGFPRLAALVAAHPGGATLIPALLSDLERFTDPGWEQEDDVTLLTVQRLPNPAALPVDVTPSEPAELTTLAEFAIASIAGHERQALERVADAVEPLALPPPLLDRVKTAVAEAAMNAIEHGNGFQADRPVGVTVRASPAHLVVAITDQGGARPIPAPPMPDLDAKLAGLQTARGWGLFLIQHMVDDLRISGDGAHHTVELVFAREGVDRGR